MHLERVFSMNSEIKADLASTLSAVAAACDLAHLRLQHHGERVAYLALRLGNHLGLGQERVRLLTLSSLVHDIGIVTTREKLEVADLDPSPNVLSLHAKRGYDLLMSTRYLRDLSLPVLHHHDCYHQGLDLSAAIICLVDRVELLLQRDEYCLWQVDGILQRLEDSKGSAFHPDVVECFADLARTPSLWLDLQTGNYVKWLRDNPEMKQILSLEQLEDIAELFAVIVDSKSPFTASHSTGLAEKTVIMCEKLGMGPLKARQMRLAALLHDIGKLAVPEDILLGPRKLTPEEQAVMKQHTYHTYHLIGMIGKGLEPIQQWASFHHERLDGSGYPFGLTGDQLDMESRLLAVLDVFQALTEDRPYRKPLSLSETAAILRKEVQANHLDGDLVELVIRHGEELIHPAS